MSKSTSAIWPSYGALMRRRSVGSSVNFAATRRTAYACMAPVLAAAGVDAAAYLDACVLATDEDGNPRPRPVKGNKEISLMRTILEYGIRKGVVKTNPFADVEKLKTRTENRLVTDSEMALALEVGRAMGGPKLIVALALRTAWLCLRRSVEVRALTRSQITEAGIEWTAAKRQAGQAQRASSGAGSKTRIPVSCVEQGRWAARGMPGCLPSRPAYSLPASGAAVRVTPTLSANHSSSGSTGQSLP